MSIVISEAHSGWGVTRKLTNPNKQFCCLWNLEIFRRIYLPLISVSFLSFQSLLHFRQSKLGVTSPFLMKSSFSQNQIFNKKRISYTSSFQVLCLTPFVPDITFITLLLSQIYVCTTSYRLLNVPGRKWWHSNRLNIFSKFML